MWKNTSELEAVELYQLLTGGVIPRPIAWVSTENRDGLTNLAPYSFFSVASCNPPILTITNVPSRDTLAKDTLANLMQTKECVVNIVTHAEVQNMNASCAAMPRDKSEIDEIGIATVPSKSVKVVGVKNAPVRYECKLRESITLSEKPIGGVLILLDVVAIYADQDKFNENLLQADLIDAVGKLGGNDYCRAKTEITLARP
mgnify:CR=1 FL=1